MKPERRKELPEIWLILVRLGVHSGTDGGGLFLSIKPVKHTEKSGKICDLALGYHMDAKLLHICLLPMEKVGQQDKENCLGGNSEIGQIG